MSSLLEVVMLSFQPNFCKERHLPREVTKAFSAPSLTNSYWAAVTYEVQYRACKGPNTFWSCQLLHYSSHDDLVAAGQSPVIEDSVIVILSRAYIRHFHSPPLMCSADVWWLWRSDGSPNSNLLGRNPALLPEKFWQLFHDWHQALFTPLHFAPLLGSYFKTPAYSSLFYSQLS